MHNIVLFTEAGRIEPELIPLYFRREDDTFLKEKCTYSFERSFNDDKIFFFLNKINYYFYFQSRSNIQSVIKYTLVFN